jgi:hypothetical protein
MYILQRLAAVKLPEYTKVDDTLYPCRQQTARTPRLIRLMLIRSQMCKKFLLLLVLVPWQTEDASTMTL